jgi:hypothetical protein
MAAGASIDQMAKTLVPQFTHWNRSAGSCAAGCRNGKSTSQTEQQKPC